MGVAIMAETPNPDHLCDCGLYHETHCTISREAEMLPYRHAARAIRRIATYARRRPETRDVLLYTADNIERIADAADELEDLRFEAAHAAQWRAACEAAESALKTVKRAERVAACEWFEAMLVGNTYKDQPIWDEFLEFKKGLLG